MRRAPGAGGDADDGGAIRLRLRVGPRSPLHPLLAALPPEQQARTLLRLAEAAARQGTESRAGDGAPMTEAMAPGAGGSAGSVAPGEDVSGAGPTTPDGAPMAGPVAPAGGPRPDGGLVAALDRIAAAVERLAEGASGGRSQEAAAPGSDGEARAAKLNGAWDA